MTLARPLGHSNETAGQVLFPGWAHLYLLYKRRTPNHRGKSFLLRQLHKVGLSVRQPFVWRMRNGALLAISPVEGYAPWSVGWTCFEHGAWEPHIENALRMFLKPGGKAMDIGANLGYFSAVMAQSVGSLGRVWAFEPVQATFERLQICQSLNAFHQMDTLRLALGDDNCDVEIGFDPAIMGGASLHQDSSAKGLQINKVPMARLDDLVQQGRVAAPDLIKIDVEGHERDVFLGARGMIEANKPTIIFEYNVRAAANAGWKLEDIGSLLRSCGDYRFFSFSSEGKFAPMDVTRHALSGDDYVDVCAVARESDLAIVAEHLN